MTIKGAVLQYWSLGLFLAFVTLTGCTRSPAISGASPFPTPNEAAEWTRTSDIRTFAAADLWKYIDGEAERYVSAGVQSASTADYRFRNEHDAVVDLYRMAEVAGAEKILASEPVNGGEVIRLGDSARLYAQSLIFCEGPYLVRITAFEESPEMKSALLTIGRAVEARLRTNL
jgi:hypothetical protein